MPKQSILCEKIFSQNLMQISALLQVKAENGKTSCFIILPISVHMWHLIFFWHARYFPVFWRPQENLGQYPFHSPSSCLQQKITLLFLVDIFRTRVKHLISSLFTDIAYSKAHFWNKICPQNSFVSSAFHFHIKAGETTSSLCAPIFFYPRPSFHPVRSDKRSIATPTLKKNSQPEFVYRRAA